MVTVVLSIPSYHTTVGSSRKFSRDTLETSEYRRDNKAINATQGGEHHLITKAG